MEWSLVQVGDMVEQDLHMMPGMGRLEQCHNYSLTVLPSPKVVASVYFTQFILVSLAVGGPLHRLPHGPGLLPQLHLQPWQGPAPEPSAPRTKGCSCLN